MSEPKGETMLKRKGLGITVLTICFLAAVNNAFASERQIELRDKAIREIEHEDSPFGFLGPVSGGPKSRWQDYVKYLGELNVHWVRNGGIEELRWGDVQPYEGAPYDWGKYDNMIRALQAKNINLLPCIVPVTRWKSSDRGGMARPGELLGPREKIGSRVLRKKSRIRLPSDLAAYKKFVEAAVERYDGDGINDMRGLEFPIKWWMTSHEPNHPHFWGDSPENYAILVKNTCQAIKKADPEAKIVLAGTAGGIRDYLYADEKIPQGFTVTPLALRKKKGKDGFFITMLRKLQEIAPESKQWIDVMDFHIFVNFGDYSKIGRFVHYINRLTKDFGLGEKPLWITETCTFAGKLKMKQVSFQEGAREYQSEREQAQELFKRYVFGIANGVKKTFWGGPVCAGGDSFFGNSGIIRPKGEPMLAYYTYKKMVQKLEGSDWNNVETVETGLRNTRIFKFMKKDNNLPIYVAWWDYYKEDEEFKMQNNKKWVLKIDANQVKITTAVPKEDSGAKIKDYESAFKTETLPVKNSAVTISFDKGPFFLEPVN